MYPHAPKCKFPATHDAVHFHYTGPHLWRTQIDMLGQQVATQNWSTEDGSERVAQGLSTKDSSRMRSLTCSFTMRKQNRSLRGSCCAWHSLTQERHGTNYERLESSAMALISISSKFL